MKRDPERFRFDPASAVVSEVTTFLMRHMCSFVRFGGVGLHLPPIILSASRAGASHDSRSIAKAAALPMHLIDVRAGTAAFQIAGIENG